MSSSILVVDDEPGIRDLLAWELRAQGHSVVTAADGAEALEEIRRAEFDLLICDVRMPRVGGLEVLKVTKETAPETEVVIATGYAEIEYAIECVRQGAFDFIQKPFNTADLLATVSRALERRRLRRTAGLYEASRAILEGQEPQRLPELIVRLAIQAMQADDASLMLPDSDGRLYIAHSHSLSPEIQTEVRLALSDGIAGRVAAIGEPALLPDRIDEDPRFSDLTSTGRIRSSIVYPLLAGKRVIGVLSINRFKNRRPFRKPDLERAAILASQILLALENARLIRQVVSSERLASVGLLATSVAHEINNPVASVLANHSLLEEQLSAFSRLGALLDSEADRHTLMHNWETLGGAAFLGELQKAVGDLGAGATRIRDIVRDLKSLARRDDSNPILFDLNDPIRSALRITGAELRLRAAVRTDFGAGLEVLGSPSRLSQVFVNLLVNAAQAFAEIRDGRQNEIVIRSERKGSQVVASVSDNGPGIRPEHLARVFETFFTTKDATIGTGLGLSISREIAQSHGGDLRVESAFGDGAAFILTLPFAGTSAPEAGPPPSQDPRRRVEGAAVKRLAVLFIDDELPLLNAYRRFFGREYEVVLAEGGEQALAILSKRGDFNVIVCDLLMPKMSGMDVYRRAREIDPELDWAFVFVTGGVMQQEVQAFLRTVGNRVLEKPFDFAVLRDTIVARSISR
jgi:signal transduction histidine kinase/DNA-binding response OmpR family regulator